MSFSVARGILMPNKCDCASGIGKTVTATFLARDLEIRKHFELLIWCTLGQSPELLRMQSLVHLQATGEELPSDISTEQAQQKIHNALHGRKCLLILDDAVGSWTCHQLSITSTSIIRLSIRIQQFVLSPLVFGSGKTHTRARLTLWTWGRRARR